MKKFIYILKEMILLIKRHKLYFLAPIFILLAFLAVLMVTLGPKAIIAFIYAGI